MAKGIPFRDFAKNPKKIRALQRLRTARRSLTMASCITEDYKGILTSMITTDTEKALLLAILKAMPICPGVLAPEAAVVATKERKPAEGWNDPVTGDRILPKYFDEKGDEQEFSSISAASKALTGKFSGVVCDEQGEKCRVTSVVEILQVNGFIVRDNGDAPVKGKSTQLNIYHPKSPQLKKIG